MRFFLLLIHSNGRLISFRFRRIQMKNCAKSIELLYFMSDLDLFFIFLATADYFVSNVDDSLSVSPHYNVSCLNFTLTIDDHINHCSLRTFDPSNREMMEESAVVFHCEIDYKHVLKSPNCASDIMGAELVFKKSNVFEEFFQENRDRLRKAFMNSIFSKRFLFIEVEYKVLPLITPEYLEPLFNFPDLSMIVFLRIKATRRNSHVEPVSGIYNLPNTRFFIGIYFYPT